MRLVSADNERIQFELEYGNTLILTRDEPGDSWQPRLIMEFDCLASKNPLILHQNVKSALERVNSLWSRDTLTSVLDLLP